MSAASQPERVYEFPFTSEHFEFLRDQAMMHGGLNIPLTKKELVYGRIVRRMRATQTPSFDAYCDTLRTDESEREHFLNALTTNITQFFREPHHFDFIRDELVPTWRERLAKSSELIRIWSAGCSSGQEPYTIAITLSECFSQAELRRFSIIATDLDTTTLGIAARGIYTESAIDSLPKPIVKKYFLQGTSTNAGMVRVDSQIREMVSFRAHNLKDADYTAFGRLDVIFCRNVVIYFDQVLQRKIYAGFADVLKSDGRLFVGHSESLFGKGDDFKLIRHGIYRKAL